MYCRVESGDSSSYLLKVPGHHRCDPVGDADPEFGYITTGTWRTSRVKNNFVRDIRVYLREFPGRRVFPLMVPKLRNGLVKLFD